MSRRILTVNPGSTSTKVVLFDGDEAIFEREVVHDKGRMLSYPTVWGQMEARGRIIREELAEAGELLAGLEAVVGRGGLLAPLVGGTYRVTERMLDDLRSARYGEHPCNLGAPLALELARERGVPAFVVDPVVTDELRPEARLTGLPGVMRRSAFHALSQRGAAREVAARRGLRYEDGKFLVAHLGGGVSVGAHLRGRVVDVTNALDGEGPLTPERTGALPVLEVLRLLEEGAYDVASLRRAVLREGGVYAHLGTNDFREVERRIEGGDEKARAVLEAVAYTVAKSAAGLVPALVTKDDPAPVDAVVLAGGLAHSEPLVAELRRRLSPLAPVELVLGLAEALVMARGGAAALDGVCEILEYRG